MAFTRRMRQIFKWQANGKWHALDPLEADLAIDAVDLDWKAKLTLASELKDPEAIRDILAVARKIFGLTEFSINEETGEENDGWTPVQVAELLGDFMKWRQDLQNFTEPPQTSQQSTAAAPQATENGTDSTSTSPAKSPETA